MIYRIDVDIETPVNPTEVSDRVEEAVYNVFPDAELERDGNRLVGESHSLARLSELLHQREILDTARGAFFDGREDNQINFSLKKQAAWVGVATFAVGEPSELGDIDVTVTVHEPTVEQLIDHIAPPTEDGKPIDVSEDG